MKVSNPSHAQILNQIGLISIENCDRTVFTSYVPSAYRDSETESMDEVYRMRECVLLHTRTGLRISYLTTESYFGDEVEYSVFDCFVITQLNQKQEVQSVNLQKQLFVTEAGTVFFDEVRKVSEERD